MYTDDLIPAADQAKSFRQVRQAHQLETTEDYVELIADLIQTQSKARQCELAKRFGISTVTVNKVLNRLQAAGYINRDRYQPITLTKKGVALAKQCKRRHQIVIQCLMKLGVSPTMAARDAEGIEHHISDETLNAMQDFCARDLGIEKQNS